MKLTLYVKPRARKNKVEQLDEQTYKVWVTAAPDKGKANQAVIKLLTKYFGTSSSRIEIVSGHTIKKKSVSIEL